MDIAVNNTAQDGIVRRKKGLSGSTLKIVAIVSMLIDHIGAVVLTRILLQRGLGDIMTADIDTMFAWLDANGGLYLGTMLLRMIGRLAFPIFCFLLVEGFQKTHDVKKYALRLGLFALVSEVPFDLALSGNPFLPEYQNVFFTLFLGLLVLIGIQAVEKQGWNKFLKLLAGVVILAAGMAAAKLLRTDYDAVGVLLIAALYVFRSRKAWQILAGCVVLGPATLLLMGNFAELPAMLAFLFIGFYNGERGLRMKYVFYAFYPLHLLILFLISVLMGLGGIPAI